MHVVLVEPEIPQNTGNIGKLGFSTSDYYLRRAGLDYWESVVVSYHDSLDELKHLAGSGCFYYVSTKAARLYTEIRYCWNDYLVFGSETRGLPRELVLENPDSSIKIPMWGTKPRSLNLSNAAAIVLYEALRQIKRF
jgi:tRNA (cytidine/uridine-2'-O-)-methyltransferase